ncbi:metallophosphoesterase [soil metagenome]
MDSFAPLRLQLASDLHLEHLQLQFPGERIVSPAPDADLLVLAGDIENGPRAVRAFADWPVPVLLIAGNHEFYDHHWESTRVELRRASEGTSVILLDNDRADFSRFTDWSARHAAALSRLRIFGTTLWTDYGFPCGLSQRQLMDHAESRIVDHRAIQTSDGPFRAEQALDDHRRSRDWLERELATPFDGKTIVITHHGPHPNSVHPRFRAPETNATNASFVSDLTALMPQVDLWLHGHVHDSFDYRLGRCRVVTNPRGYALNRRHADYIAEVMFENDAFRPDCVVTA